MLVKGKHEPLVSDDLFNEVQDVLNGRKRKPLGRRYGLKDEYPLRGYLICQHCGRILTGSSARGNGGLYFYYHCVKGCKERAKAEEVNGLFLKALKTINSQINRNTIDYQRAILHHHLNIEPQDKTKRIDQLKAAIEKNEQSLKNARKKLFDGEIEVEDLNEAKNIYQPEINRLQQELSKVNTNDETLIDQVETCLQIVTQLPESYATGDLLLKQQLIGLIYPEKAVLKENRIQTIRSNRAIELICRPSLNLGNPKTKMVFKNEDHSNVVTPSGLSPAPAGRLR
jgi:hypothetical protein